MIYYKGKAQGVCSSAYDLAKAGGFSGTDAEFETSLANLDKIKTTNVEYILDSSNYTKDNHYSFETDYPNEKYNLTMEIDGDKATTDQMNMYYNAIFSGSNTSNIIKINGVKPTDSIPVILEVEKK
jgi:hypothetical protein